MLFKLCCHEGIELVEQCIQIRTVLTFSHLRCRGSCWSLHRFSIIML
jgi:hypothetical protein